MAKRRPMTEADKTARWGPVAARFASKRDPATEYEVRLTASGQVSCNCMAWATKKTCPHVLGAVDRGLLEKYTRLDGAVRYRTPEDAAGWATPATNDFVRDAVREAIKAEGDKLLDKMLGKPKPTRPILRVPPQAVKSYPFDADMSNEGVRQLADAILAAGDDGKIVIGDGTLRDIQRLAMFTWRYLAISLTGKTATPQPARAERGVRTIILED
jgi:hypothetical protein